VPTITLKYGSGGANSRDFNAISVKGFVATDGHNPFPGVRLVYLNGGLGKIQIGFRRVFQIILAGVTDPDDLVFLGLFLNNEEQYVSYTYNSGLTVETDVQVVDSHEDGFESVWEHNVEIGRTLNLVLEEATVRSTYPIQSGYGFSSDDLSGGL